MYLHEMVNLSRMDQPSDGRMDQHSVSGVMSRLHAIENFLLPRYYLSSINAVPLWWTQVTPSPRRIVCLIKRVIVGKSIVSLPE